MDQAHPNDTESLCPVCLKRIKATRLLEGDKVSLIKTCGHHGSFSTVIWRGEPSMGEWQRPKDPVHPDLCYGVVEKGCPFDCGLCAAHAQLPCSVLLEVTDRCNLHCPVCFADSGSAPNGEPSLERISWLLERAMASAGPTNLQLSGGEPTLRDDLPEIIEAARRVGYSFIQLNTNGLLLASNTSYAKKLRQAGLSSVFLQFDGVDDAIYKALRGRALFEEKLKAIRNCGESGLGVVLVPTLVAGVNTGSIGAIVRQALHTAPTVRGIHFQPVSYFGRFPRKVGDEGRFTLPELMRSLEEQTEGLVKVTDFSPPGCEHAHCSFHATYVRSAKGELKAIGGAKDDTCCLAGPSTGGVRNTVETVSRRWSFPSTPPNVKAFMLKEEATASCCDRGKPDAVRHDGALDLDFFLQEVALRSFTLSAMAFQDVDNLDMERLKGCCISVISPDGRLIPFCAYNLTSRDGRSLYRERNGP